MFIIEQKFGNDGYAFWFKLLELLGDTADHYIDLKKGGSAGVSTGENQAGRGISVMKSSTCWQNYRRLTPNCGKRRSYGVRTLLTEYPMFTVTDGQKPPQQGRVSTDRNPAQE